MVKAQQKKALEICKGKQRLPASFNANWNRIDKVQHFLYERTYHASPGVPAQLHDSGDAA
jgi:hypothetical protein